MLEKITVSRDEVLNYSWIDHTWVYIHYTKNSATTTSEKVITAMIKTARYTEKLRSIKVTPTDKASILVATACIRTSPKVKGAGILQELASSLFLHFISLIISTIIFIARAKKIPAEINLIIVPIWFLKRYPIKKPISGIMP